MTTGANDSTSSRQVRIFGGTAWLLFGAIGALAWWRGRPLVASLWWIPAGLGLMLLLLPGPFSPLYRAWLAVARGIGLCMNVVLLTLVFYLILTPLALLKRVLGGRPLPLRPDRTATTYWVKRPLGAQPREQYYRRY
jgi:hypothetical protein